MSDSGRERQPDGDRGSETGYGKIWQWIVLDGNRLLVAAGPFVAVVVAVATLEAAGLVPLRSLQPTYYLFSGFIGGNLTLITVVVSINQLLLSRELQSPGELQDRIENVTGYRRDVEDAAGEVAPVQPLGFLRLLVEVARREAQRAGGFAAGEVPADVREDLDEVVEELTGNFDDIDALLQQSRVGTFHVLSATLTTNYAEPIKRIRKLRAAHDEDLPVDLQAALGELTDRLRQIDVARQYFKSVYLQEELSALSRILLYGGIPAEAMAAFVLLTYTAAGGAALPREALLAVIPLAVALAFLPLFLLASFVLRIATVTQRTVAVLPFTTPGQER